VLLTEAESASAEQKAALTAAGIQLYEQSVADLFIDGDEISAVLKDKERIRVEVLYPALGSIVRSDLAVALGAKCTANSHLEVDAHQRTSISGLYAAGDVVNELNQICVATGHAAIAATDIYNSLRQRNQQHSP
jgi:thioredoxin reductase (NADPH)